MRSEEHVECRACLANALRREREVDLQPVGEQEHAVDQVATGQIEQGHSSERLRELACPVIQHLGHRGLRGDSEGEIEIRPAVPVPLCERADYRGRDDARVALGEPEQVVAYSIAGGDG